VSRAGDKLPDARDLGGNSPLGEGIPGFTFAWVGDLREWSGFTQIVKAIERGR